MSLKALSGEGAFFILRERGTPDMTQGTCTKHEEIALKINTAEQEIKAMQENIGSIKKDNERQTDKLDKLGEQLSTLHWKLIGGIGSLVIIAQIIIQFVK